MRVCSTCIYYCGRGRPTKTREATSSAICVYVYIYIYMYREREREVMYVCVYMYIYIYIERERDTYIHTYVGRPTKTRDATSSAKRKHPVTTSDLGCLNIDVCININCD